MFICLCEAVTDKQVKQAVEFDGVRCVKDLREHMAIGTQCGRCVRVAREIIDEMIDPSKAESLTMAV